MGTTIARILRRDATLAERRLWQQLRFRQLDGHRFRRQAPIGRFVVDFVCFEQRLIVEVDGGQHAERAQEDAKRTRWLEGEGFRVLRFWNSDVLQNTEAVVESIRGALRV
jgi:very-short-patch-repair endonuclease